MLENVLKNKWGSLLSEEFQKDYFKKLEDFLKEEYAHQVVYPTEADLFQALNMTDYDDVKAVIIGQDPYHGPGQAHGLSFSVQPGTRLPPSLRNIYKELQSDVGCETPRDGYLGPWAKEGVLLLNTVMTVRGGEAHSHKGKGWETFTDRIISLLNQREKPVVFILWGKPAQKKMSLINQEQHHVITGVHPSPLSASRGFFGSRPFSKSNEFLKKIGEPEINWCLSSSDTM